MSRREHREGLALPHWLDGLECGLDEIAELLSNAVQPAWAERLEGKINLILQLEGVIITDQEHLDSDVAALSTDFAAIIADLKDQAGNAPVALDFTAADALVASVHAALPVTVPPADPPSDISPVVDPVQVPPVTVDASDPTDPASPASTETSASVQTP